MFRRKWSSLPEDPEFPLDLEGLGYFVNDEDEIRSIEKPKNYFKFFINKNERWNDRQRFSMNHAVENIVHARLEALGLEKIRLPFVDDVDDSLETRAETLQQQSSPDDPHVPIFVSRGIEKKSRVVLIVGESFQDLGVLAHRVIGGRGGINKGSMVSVVSSLLSQPCSADDPEPPGVILANTGQSFWWPPLCRALNRVGFQAAPMRSGAHMGHLEGRPENAIPRNSGPEDHVAYVFEQVLPRFVRRGPDAAGIDLLCVGDGCEFVESYLDSSDDGDDDKGGSHRWVRWAPRLNCLAMAGGTRPHWEISDPGLRAFLRHKARAFVTSLEPAGVILSGTGGNDQTVSFTDQGCPVFSSGEPYYVETILVRGLDLVLDFLREVATNPAKEGGARGFLNPLYHVEYVDPNRCREGGDGDGVENGWGGAKWKQPLIEVLKNERDTTLGDDDHKKEKEVIDTKGGESPVGDSTSVDSRGPVVSAVPASDFPASAMTTPVNRKERNKEDVEEKPKTSNKKSVAVEEVPEECQLPEVAIPA